MENIVTDGVGSIAQEDAPNNEFNNPPVVANNIATADVSNPNYIEFNRLKTFPRLWSHRFTKRELSRNGFYHTTGNVCECAFCEATLALDLVTGPQSLEQVHQQLRETCDFAFHRDVSRNIPLGDVSDYR